ncbi:hypothetical protein C8Q76DRAFT_823107 [Earliella scabrosa]|nr:hypothetical protein C8Q76DRAFT_823107 [Earliella scabrosa]
MIVNTIEVSATYMMHMFVPTPSDEDEPADDAPFTIDFNGVPNKGPESGMYKPLMGAINDSGLTPGYTCVATPNKLDITEDTKQRINGAMYFADQAPSEAEQTKWGAIELSLDVKPESVQDDDPDDDDDTPESQPAADRHLGQIQSYSTLVFDKQHRTHHFTVLFFGDMARIIRWDRSGTVVTEKFNYKTDSAILGRFLWRFSRMTPQQCGHDLTVVPVLVDSPEYKLMVRRRDTPRTLKGTSLVVGEDARRMFKDSLRDPAWWRMNIGDRGFLVGAPHFIASGLAGRGTRGYVAIDLEDQDGPFVYLKDCWRVAHERIEREGDILAYLNDPTTGEVTNIPMLVCHGDVEDQETQTQTVWRERYPDTECPFKTHRHYRMVVKEVGLPMSNFRNGRPLLGLLAMCISAHWGAYKKGIIHGDISDGNVLILPVETVGPDGKLRVSRIGMLADWELSKRVHDDGDTPRQLDCTFMSAHALKNLSRKRMLVEDEMESWFHLLLYFALRYLPHNCLDLGHFINDYFDGFVEANGEYYCGDTKWSALNIGAIFVDGNTSLKFFRSPPPIPSAPVQPRAVENGNDNAATPPETTAASTATIAPVEGSEEESESSTEDVPSSSHKHGADLEPHEPQPLPFEEDPKNDHPINGLIREFLKAIHTYYVLCRASSAVDITPRGGALPPVVELDESDPFIQDCHAMFASIVDIQQLKLQGRRAAGGQCGGGIDGRAEGGFGSVRGSATKPRSDHEDVRQVLPQQAASLADSSGKASHAHVMT